MSLGENIVKLRTEKGWTQDDLAERILTSRQSVSKWETNASVPELEKLLRLSELFGVTLDELVKGTKSQTTVSEDDMLCKEKTDSVRQNMIGVSRNKSVIHTTQGIMGLILFVLGAVALLFFTMLGGFLTGLLFAVPLLGCSAICLTVKKRAGLWCGWFLYGIVHFTSLYMTGITWQAIFTSWLVIKMYGNPVRVLIAWVFFGCMVGMIIATMFSYRKLTIDGTNKNKRSLIMGWTIWAALVIIPFIIGRTEWYSMIYQSILDHGFSERNYGYMMLTATSQILDAIKLVLFTVLLVRTRAFIRGKKNIK